MKDFILKNSGCGDNNVYKAIQSIGFKLAIQQVDQQDHYQQNP
jgi:hypothetical protein